MYNVTMKQYENTQVTNPILLFKMKSHQIQVREKEMERSHLKKKFLKKYEREQIKKKKTWRENNSFPSRCSDSQAIWPCRDHPESHMYA